MKPVSIRLRAATRDRGMFPAHVQMFEVRIVSRDRRIQFSACVTWTEVEATESNGAVPRNLVRNAWRRARAGFKASGSAPADGALRAIPADAYAVKSGYESGMARSYTMPGEQLPRVDNTWRQAYSHGDITAEEAAERLARFQANNPELVAYFTAGHTLTGREPSKPEMQNFPVTSTPTGRAIREAWALSPGIHYWWDMYGMTKFYAARKIERERQLVERVIRRDSRKVSRARRLWHFWGRPRPVECGRGVPIGRAQ